MQHVSARVVSKRDYAATSNGYCGLGRDDCLHILPIVEFVICEVMQKMGAHYENRKDI